MRIATVILLLLTGYGLCSANDKFASDNDTSVATTITLDSAMVNSMATDSVTKAHTLRLQQTALLDSINLYSKIIAALDADLRDNTEQREKQYADFKQIVRDYLQQPLSDIQIDTVDSLQSSTLWRPNAADSLLLQRLQSLRQARQAQLAANQTLTQRYSNSEVATAISKLKNAKADTLLTDEQRQSLTECLQLLEHYADDTQRLRTYLTLDDDNCIETINKLREMSNPQKVIIASMLKSTIKPYYETKADADYFANSKIPYLNEFYGNFMKLIEQLCDRQQTSVEMIDQLLTYGERL